MTLFPNIDDIIPLDYALKSIQFGHNNELAALAQSDDVNTFIQALNEEVEKDISRKRNMKKFKDIAVSYLKHDIDELLVKFNTLKNSSI